MNMKIEILDLIQEKSKPISENMLISNHVNLEMLRATN